MKIVKPFVVCTLTSILCACAGTGAAWRAYEAKDYEEAKKQAAYALMSEPQNPEVYRVIALTHIAQGNYPQAVSAAKLGASFSNNSAENVAVLQSAYEHAQDWPAFCDLERLRAASGSTRNFDAELYTKASRGAAFQNQAAAYGCYERLAQNNESVRKSSEFERSASAYAELLAQNGHYRAAIDLVKALDNSEYKHLQAARYHYALREFEEASRGFDAYVSTAKDQDQRGKNAEAVADFYASQRQYAPALKYYAQSQRSSASHKRLKLAISNRDAAQLDEALGLIEADNTLDALQYEDLAKTLANSGYADKGASLLERALIAHPQSAALKLQLATMYDQIGDVAKRESLLAAWAQEEQNKKKTAEQIFYWYEARKSWPQARATGERRVLMGEVELKFLMALAQVYAQTKDFEAMDRMLDKAVNVAQNDKERANATRLEAARIAQKYYSWQKSISYLLALQASEPQNKDAAWLLAKAYEHNQEDELAYKTLLTWAKASDKEPEALLEIAGQYDNLAQHDYFERSMAQLLGKSTLQTQAHLLNAQHALRLGDEELALKSSQAAVDASEDKAQGYENVINHLDQSIGSRKLALIMAHKAVAFSPFAPKPYYTLAELQILSQENGSFYDSLTKYVANSLDKAQATQSSIMLLSRFSRQAQAQDWVNATTTQYAQDSAMNLVLGDYYTTLAAAQAPDSVQAFAYAGQAHDAYTQFIQKSQDQTAIQNLGVSQEARGEHDMALAAFTKARSLGELSAISQSYEIFALLESGHDKEAQKNISAFAKDQSDVAQVLTLSQELSNRNFSAQAGPLYERLLSADSPAQRSIAYRRVISLAIDNGERQKVEQISERYASKKPLTMEMLEDLFHTWLQIEDWPKAIDIWEQMETLRPGSAQLLSKLLTIHAVEGENGLTAPILKRYLESSPLLAPSLAQIGEFYDLRGQNREALEYYTRSLAISQFPSSGVLRRALHLTLVLGNTDAAPALIEKLKAIGAWDLETILATSQDYHQTQDPQQAQNLIQEAFAQHPKSLELHTLRIDQAFQSGNNVQALSFAQNYLAQGLPTAVLIDILARNNAIDEALSLLDSLQMDADFDVALNKTLQYDAEIAQQRGNAALVMELRSLAQDARYSLPAYQKLVEYSLAQNNTLEAANYAVQSSDYALQFATLAHDPAMHPRLASIITSEQTQQSPTQQRDFAQKTITGLQNLGLQDLAYDFAFQNPDPRQTDLNSAQLALSQGRTQDALGIFYTGAFADLLSAKPSSASATQFFAPLQLLSQFQQSQTAAGLAHDWHAAQSQNLQLEEALWKARIVLTSDARLEPTPFPKDPERQIFWAEHFPDHVDLTILKELRKHVLPTNRATVIKLHIIHAAKHPNDKEQIKSILSEWQNQSPNALAIQSPALDFAQAEHLDDLSYQYAQSLSKKRPRVVAYYLSQMHALRATDQSQKALDALMEAAKRDPKPLELLKEQLPHFDKPQEARLVLPLIEEILLNEPQNSNSLIYKLQILLRDQHYQNAARFVENILSHDSTPLTFAKISNCYAQNKAIDKIPEIMLQTANANDERLALIADLEISQKRFPSAANHYIQAAQKSLNPLKFYERGANAFIASQNTQFAEQLSELALESYPRAPAPHLTRAKIHTLQGNEQAALQDFTYALTHSPRPLATLENYAQFLVSQQKSAQLLAAIAQCQKSTAIAKSDQISAIATAFERENQKHEGEIFIATHF